MYTVTKEFNFEAGHTLSGHRGKCKNLHGHNYKVFVTLKADKLNDMDMVEDFYDLNQTVEPLIQAFDHAFMYNRLSSDPFETDVRLVCEKHGRKVIGIDFRPTAERMAAFFYKRIKNYYPKIEKVVVYETPTSFATYSEEE